MAIELLFLGWFIVVAAVSYARNNKASMTAEVARAAPEGQNDEKTAPWRMHMWALFATSGLIFLRSVFRVVEYVQGDNGYLLSHEVYLYVFDAALMIAVLVILNLIHPSQIRVA